MSTEIMTRMQRLERRLGCHLRALPSDFGSRPSFMLRKSPFLELAAELRNAIYELSFTTNETLRNGGVDMETAVPPTKSLLLVNHQIYNETKQFYEEATKAFYSNHFKLFMPFDADGPGLVKSAHARLNLQNITRLTVSKVRSKDSMSVLWADLHEDGETWVITTCRKRVHSEHRLLYSNSRGLVTRAIKKDEDQADWAFALGSREVLTKRYHQLLALSIMSN